MPDCIQHFLRQDPRSALEAIILISDADKRDTNWELLREIAHNNITKADSLEESIGWSEVSIRAAILAGREPHEQLQCRLLVGALLISKFGPSLYPLQNPDMLGREAFEAFPVSLPSADTAFLALGWRVESSAFITELRRAKNILSAVREFHTHITDRSLTDFFQSWFKNLPKLP